MWQISALVLEIKYFCSLLLLKLLVFDFTFLLSVSFFCNVLFSVEGLNVAKGIEGCFKFFSDDVGFVSKRSCFSFKSYTSLLFMCERKAISDLSNFVVCLENPKLFVNYIHNHAGFVVNRCAGEFINKLLEQKVI